MRTWQIKQKYATISENIVISNSLRNSAASDSKHSYANVIPTQCSCKFARKLCCGVIFYLFKADIRNWCWFQLSRVWSVLIKYFLIKSLIFYENSLKTFKPVRGGRHDTYKHRVIISISCHPLWPTSYNLEVRSALLGSNSAIYPLSLDS